MSRTHGKIPQPIYFKTTPATFVIWQNFMEAFNGFFKLSGADVQVNELAKQILMLLPLLLVLLLLLDVFIA